MDDETETVWRKGLQARGKDWVRSELHRRPGRPEDVLYDVVFKEPYPTRAFCFQWCGEEENRYFRMSWHTYGAIIALVLLIVSILKGISAWDDAANSLRIRQSQMTGNSTAQKASGGPQAAGAPQSAGAASTLTNDIPSMSTSSSVVNTSSSNGTTSSSSGTTASGSGLTTGLSAPASICGYITYDSPRCPHQN